MVVLVFVLGLILAVAGGAGLFASVDLLPTEAGILYAACGTLALCSGVIVLSIGALLRRVDQLAEEFAPRAVEPAFATGAAAPYVAPQLHEAPEAHSEPHLPAEPAFSVEAQTPLEAALPDPEPAPATAPADEEDPLNENRAGHLPTMAEVEHAIAEPEAPPTLVGRYSAGGANYMIFSDGTIEAETEQGAFKFASMGDFKAYLAGGKDGA
jgi:hypothetical protein